MRIPNQYGLPIGTRVPFGKVDHNTMEWSDFRELYSGPGQPPDEYLGTVISATEIEVQFDHFCAPVCGLCKPDPKLLSNMRRLKESIQVRYRPRSMLRDAQY